MHANLTFFINTIVVWPGYDKAFSEEMVADECPVLVNKTTEFLNYYISNIEIVDRINNDGVLTEQDIRGRWPIYAKMIDKLDDLGVKRRKVSWRKKDAG